MSNIGHHHNTASGYNCCRPSSYDGHAGSAPLLVKPLTSLKEELDFGTKGTATPAGGRNAEHYKQIGDALMRCEIASFRIGIPWLPPTSRIRQLQKPLYGSPADFIRIELSNVSTSCLESYAEDLATLPFDSAASRTLRIAVTSIFERYFAMALIGLITMGGAAASFLAIPATFVPGLVSSAALGATAMGFAYYQSTEKYRRMSFAWLLSQEILRRKGLDTGGNSRIPIIGLGARPLSD